MRVVSLNANGIRSAARKGFFDWFAESDTDLLCLQETKAQRHQLDDPIFHPAGYQNWFCDALKPGYSGVAIYSRHQPDRVEQVLGREDFDSEGRYLRVDFGDLSVISLYLPSGSSSELRQDYKFRVMDWMLPILDRWLHDGRKYILCGDWNIAHREVDLKNWRGNRKNSGFLPEERAWMETLLVERGWVDSYRSLRPEGTDYTWWSNRGQAWAKDVGWRIDYQIVSPSLRDQLLDCHIHREPRFSDHAPFVVDYAMEPRPTMADLRL